LGSWFEEMTAGTKLGPYEIVSQIGKGGMGEVWKARDPRLNRDVAIKISAQQFTDRFEREAHAIAALNHPNICTLYDVGPNYLVMELVEGPTLAERIAQGPVPLEEALAIAKQIADALEAAHEKSIVHRDLKPANVKIKPDGQVKVLDFGLAKSGGIAELSSDSPTALTVAGMILGTAGYMAPEQAKGKVADKRADIWAFGVVLYEMLTGKRLFEGETVSETLAEVLKEQPALNRVPAKVRPLLRRCLEKDPKLRLRDISGVELLLEGTTAAPLQSRFGKAGWIAAGAFAVIAAALGFVHFREKPPAVYPVRFQVPLPDKGTFGRFLALSPDGHKLAFTTTGPEGGIWVRDLDSLELRLLPGTQNVFSLFWSPDSRYLAFGIGNQLKKTDASGGPAQTLCELPSGNVGSGAWNRDGVIIFGSPSGPLRRVSAEGGVATDLTVLDPSRQEGAHVQPTFLPDGRHFIYFHPGSPENSGVFVGSLDVKPADQSRERLVATTFGASWAPSASGTGGHLFFLRDGTLMAQPFDAGRLKLTGEPVPVAERVGALIFNGFFSISANGALAYRTGVSSGNRQLAWFDRQGKQPATAFEPGPYLDLSLSPDGTRAAILRGSTANADFWLHDFTRGVSTRFTFDQKAGETGAGKGPVWSPDGTRIAFSSTRGGVIDLLEKLSSGAGNEALLAHSDFNKTPDDWSRDGRFLLYTEVNGKTSYDLMVLPLQGSDRKPVPLVNTTFAEAQGSFSPDTRWFAYGSNESGRVEVYVQPFTPPGSGATPAVGKWQISRDGGRRPKWRPDGKELIFRAPNGTPMAVDITTSPSFQAGIPKPLFTMPANAGPWDVTADGKRFLAIMPLQAQQNANTPITVVLNWEAGLKLV
jgi:Tol biopolymer transport system component/tRNA A-37 threonylcarbamoyl transferase component Bud32